MSQPKPASGLSTLILLYWLLLIAGLAGVTVVSADTPREVFALWLGSVVGVGFGQLLAGLRIRTWLATSIVFLVWLQAAMLYDDYSSAMSFASATYAPAALCGYLSLSERMAPAAFWYPAVLWMVVILDRPHDALDAHAVAPFVAGLGAFFVAFLMLVQSRRLALWRGHATFRLAEPRSRVVLRSSPLRAASQQAWTALVGVATLMLTVWVAPHLWQSDQAHESTPSAGSATMTTVASGNGGGGGRCCAAGEVSEVPRETIVEYLPFLHGQHEAETDATRGSCVPCYDGVGVASEGGSAGENSMSGAEASRAAAAPEPSPAPLPGRVAEAQQPPQAKVPPKVATRPQVIDPAPTSAPIAPATPIRFTVAIKPTAPLEDAGTPWAKAAWIAAVALGVHAVFRALRRQLTLRHLTNPFWPESVDQRFSNHWQRMLVGLRDAGIHPTPGEQPLAFARRVGLEDMAASATILERARHGMRVDEADLDAMHLATTRVFETARRLAGAPARAVAWLRWPLT